MNIAQLDTKDLISVLLKGGVVVMPTDTVYGLACLASNESAVKRMYEIKQRDGKPGTIIAGSISQVVDMRFDEIEINIASRFWPGPVSVVLGAGDNLDYLHMGKESLAVRVPDTEWLDKLLMQTGPLATTSANLPGEPTVINVTQAKQIFGEKVDLYVYGGEILDSKPSTIVKITLDGTTEVIRP